MTVRHLIALCMLTAICGSCNTSPHHAGEDASQVIQIEILKADEHFGHSITESGGHSVWCDGCRARLVPSGDPFVIYWMNNAIKDAGFVLELGQKYRVRLTGDVGTGVMGYEGKCIDIRQVMELEEQ